MNKEITDFLNKFSSYEYYATSNDYEYLFSIISNESI